MLFTLRQRKKTDKGKKNYKQTPHYLVELFYSSDQVRVTGGVFKEYIIWKTKEREHKHSVTNCTFPKCHRYGGAK